jgi:hypothetical protein
VYGGMEIRSLDVRWRGAWMMGGRKVKLGRSHGHTIAS